MQDSYKFSFNSILALVFLLPLFFVPATVLPLGVAKSALASLGAVIIFLVFLYETLKQGKLVFPSAYVLWGVFALPIVYLASALTGLSQKVSIFGYNFEPGTFGSILVLSVLMGVLSIVLADSGKILKVYGAMLLSLVIISVFGLIKVFSGGKALGFGALGGIMGNPIGAWTDYAVMFGLTSLISLFALEILPMKANLKKIVYGLLAVSVFLLMVINFSTAWQLVFVGSLVAVVYFMTIEKRFDRMDGESHNNMGKFSLPLIVMVISLLFVFNPSVSGTQGGIGNTISGAFGVNNSDVRPALSTTLSVAKEAIKTHPLLGSGPNTFDRDWLMYKPAVINSTTFWNAAFPFGFGFLPTQIGAVGILGTIVWILFFAMFLWVGGRALAKNSENKAERFITVSSFLGSIFLWLAAFMYVPSMTVLALAFIFTGICVASSGIVGAVRQREVLFARNMILNFVSVLLMIILGLGTASLGFVSLQKTLSVVHFEKALVLSNTKDAKTEDVETQITSALNLSQEDIYYGAISQIEFSKAQKILNLTTGTPEQNRADFQTAIQKSILGAQGAININPGSYQNWITLGSLYGALVAKPLAIPGAYDNAKTAYQEAQKRNPQTPEAPLFLAKLEFDNDNNDAARKYIEESLSKKQDYADAYFLLTQIEIKDNNIDKAIKSAETTAILRPDNAGLFFQLGILKYSNKDNAGAIEALNYALKLVPDYANAKYYLGLSLDQVGRHDEAITQFEDLAKTNPDNQAITAVLANLKAGKDAFYKLNDARPTGKTTPPVTTTKTQ